MKIEMDDEVLEMLEQWDAMLMDPILSQEKAKAMDDLSISIVARINAKVCVERVYAKVVG